MCRAVRKDPIRRRTLHHAAAELLHRQAGVPLARKRIKGRHSLYSPPLTDWLVWRTSRSDRPTLLLLATAPVTLTFLLRPFSNSLETFCLALLLYQTSCLERYRREGKGLALVGAIVAFGCFVRVTFVSFALPACIYILRLADTFRTRCVLRSCFSLSSSAGRLRIGEFRGRTKAD